MTFADNVHKLATTIYKMRGIHTMYRCDIIDEQSSKDVSAGEFLIEFSVQRNENGWDALEWITRAVSKVRWFDLSFRNNDGLEAVFGLSFIDHTNNGGYMYDYEVEKLHNALKGIIEAEMSLRSVCDECGGVVEDEFLTICYDCAGCHIKQGHDEYQKELAEKKNA